MALPLAMELVAPPAKLPQEDPSPERKRPKEAKTPKEEAPQQADQEQTGRRRKVQDGTMRVVFSTVKEVKLGLMI